MRLIIAQASDKLMNQKTKNASNILTIYLSQIKYTFFYYVLAYFHLLTMNMNIGIPNNVNGTTIKYINIIHIKNEVYFVYQNSDLYIF